MISSIDAWQVLGMLGLLAALAAIISTTIIVVLRPFLVRYALARPNARSSHKEPTPQGGGIAVIAATLSASWLRLHFLRAAVRQIHYGSRLSCSPAIGLAMVGATDDRPSDGGAAAPDVAGRRRRRGDCGACRPRCGSSSCCPWWFERACMLIGGVWFVNSRQLHGRHRLDDGRRSRAANGRPCSVRPAWARCRTTPRSSRSRFAAR